MIYKGGNKLLVVVVLVFLSAIGGVVLTAMDIQKALLAQNCYNRENSGWGSKGVVMEELKSKAVDIGGGNSTLAYKHSGGFFDDIPDSRWTLMQQRQAKQFPNHMTRMFTGNTFLRNTANKWYQENFEPDFTCPHERRMGAIKGRGDGAKWICDPHRIKKQEKCLVYSIGCNGDPTFEKAVKEEISQDCEIHTFDINNSSFPGYLLDYEKVVSPYASFHHWGIETKEEAANNPTKFKTLEETVSLLGHVGRTVDIFKIDCETCEWRGYREWFSSGITIKQIQIELHFVPQPSARDFFYNLHNQGYAIFHKEFNVLQSNRGNMVEYAFLKLETDFFAGKMFPNNSFNAISP